MCHIDKCFVCVKTLKVLFLLRLVQDGHLDNDGHLIVVFVQLSAEVAEQDVEALLVVDGADEAFLLGALSDLLALKFDSFDDDLGGDGSGTRLDDPQIQVGVPSATLKKKYNF